MNTLKEIIGFVKRNRLLIVLLVTVMLVAEWGIKEVFRPKHSDNGISASEERSVGDNGNDDTFAVEPHGIQKQNQFPVIFLLLAAVGIYYAHKKGIFRRVLPGSVSFRAALFKKQVTGSLLMQINLQNRSRKTITFLSPNVIFKTLWGSQRKFNIRNSTFPLTLMPGTGETLTFEIDKFQNRIPELKKYNFLKAEIKTVDGKVYKTFALPRWWVSKYYV
ncbi:MAG: hypothetical protein LBV41_09725 [Cytophagaceae bacterium]|jgi:hypothetical protein|nr:hypothetical protein [Cytophagaceae bacterium]